MKLFRLLIDICIIVAAVSFIIGLISRVTFVPLAFGLVARSFLGFTIGCLLFAITLGIRELIRK